MDAKFRDNLLQERINLQNQLTKIQEKLSAVNILLQDANRIPLRIHMAKNTQRRSGAVQQVLHAVNELGNGTIKQIARKVQDLYPVEDEINLLSKVSTYLKRLKLDGDVTCDDTVKPKIYSSFNKD